MTLGDYLPKKLRDTLYDDHKLVPSSLPMGKLFNETVTDIVKGVLDFSLPEVEETKKKKTTTHSKKSK